jgi:hypothetical protein
VFLVGTVTYPSDKAVTVTQKFIRATENPLPYFMNCLYLLTAAGEDVRLKVLGIYEVEDAKLKEGIRELTKYYIETFGDVEGFRYNIASMLPAAGGLTSP